MTQPTYYLSHGGGPWIYMNGEMRAMHGALEASLRDLPGQLPETPEAVLMISAHWETAEFTVQSNEHPPMLYDYGGFPPHTYHVQYPAAGSPSLARRVQALVQSAGMNCLFDDRRGFDHGAFVPMAAMFPQANVPMIQLSLKTGLDPQLHLALGQALAPLREQGVLIVGSGSSFHNLGIRGPTARAASQAFDTWLSDTLIATAAPERTERIGRWTEAPSARQAHAREEHLIPLMVALGAAGTDPATRTYHQDDFFGGTSVSSYRFGAASSPA